MVAVVLVVDTAASSFSGANVRCSSFFWDGVRLFGSRCRCRLATSLLSSQQKKEQRQSLLFLPRGGMEGRRSGEKVGGGGVWRPVVAITNKTRNFKVRPGVVVDSMFFFDIVLYTRTLMIHFLASSGVSERVNK